MRRRFLLLGCFVFPACSTTTPNIKRLGPLSKPAVAPVVCKIAGVLPGSPASQAGLRTGDTIVNVNGTKPSDAAAVSDLIQASGPQAELDVADAAGASRRLRVTLNKEKPRLGASCDLTGWRKSSVSSAGNEAITEFAGAYAVTLSGIFDKGLAFIRARVSNHSGRPLSVGPELFSARDGNNAPLKILSPTEVMFFMHGEDGVSLVKPARPDAIETQAPAVPADSVVYQATASHKKKADWSRSDELYVQANAEYLNKESLWRMTLEPGKTADGLIYTLEAKALPLTVEARVEGNVMSVSFGTPKPSSHHMTQDQLIDFFTAQKKGSPVRLTLRTGKVFVGRYSSYDALNETVWFDTPSGVLLTTSSFGLRRISHAEAMAPQSDKKQPAPELP